MDKKVADITLEILGGTFVMMSPQSKYLGGTCPPCPIGIDAPALNKNEETWGMFFLGLKICAPSSLYTKT